MNLIADSARLDQDIHPGYIIRMPDAATDLSRDELKAAIREQGLSVTSHQLVRWHKRGLLPRPERTFFGRPGGTESRYPEIAIAQTHAILLLLQVFRRDLNSVGWYLWGFGFPVTAFVRRLLVTELEQWEKQLREGFEAFRKGDSANPIAALTTGRAPASWGTVRRRVGKKRIDTVAALLYQVLLGQFGEHGTYDAKDYELVIAALDAQTSKWSSKPVSQRVRQIPEAFELLSKELSLGATRSAVEKLSEAELCRVRDEIQTIYRIRDALRETPHDDVQRQLRTATRKIYRELGVDVRLEQPLVPKPVFLLWLAFRYVSPTMREAVAALRDELLPEPTMLARIAAFHQPATPRKKDRASRRKKR